MWRATIARNKVRDHCSITPDIMHAAAVQRQNDKPQSLGNGMHVEARCNAHPCVAVHTHTRTREPHVSDKYTPRMHRCCPLWSSSPPPGNNSKSRVINPSPLYLPSPPHHPSLSSSVCTRVCACMLMRVMLLLYLSASPFYISLSLSRVREYTHTHIQTRMRVYMSMHFYSLASPRDGYMCMMCIVANCSHANGHVPTGLIEDPLELP